MTSIVIISEMSVNIDVHNIYVQHLTNILPYPKMQVGGFARYKRRPTLHWSLLGLLLSLMSHELDIDTGKSNKKYFNFEQNPTKYAIIESLHQISHKIIGGIPCDLYTLGEHIPSSKSYIFIPMSEKELYNMSDYHGKVVYYDGFILDIMKTYCNE